MNELLKKLNFKDQEKVFILNSPPEFESNISEFQKFLKVETKFTTEKISFLISFVKTEKEILDTAKKFKQLNEDALTWFVYPKGTSKKYKSEISRDKGWDILGKYDFEGVRMIAIDEDWSAFRFKKIQKIKKFTRNEKLAMSDLGKKIAKKKK